MVDCFDLFVKYPWQLLYCVKDNINKSGLSQVFSKYKNIQWDFFFVFLHPDVQIVKDYKSIAYSQTGGGGH